MKRETSKPRPPDSNGTGDGAPSDLVEERDLLINVFSSIQDGISVLDDRLIIRRINPTMERWHSRAVPLTGRPCYEAYHGRTAPCDQCPSRRTLDNGRVEHDVVPRIGTDGKHVRWYDVYSFPLVDQRNGRTRGVIEYVRDITPQKKAEQALQENEQLMQMLLQNAPDGFNIFEVDLIKDRRTLVYCNERFVDMSGHTRQELFAYADRIDDLIVYHSTDSETPSKPASLFLSGTMQRGTCSWKRLDGKENYFEYRVVPLLIRGRPHFIGIDHDITERRRAEEALRQSEEKFRRIIETANEGIWILNANFRTSVVNPKMADLLGYTVEDMVGKPIDRYLFEEDMPDFRARIAARQMGKAEQYERRYRRKDGSVLWVSVSATPISDPDGRFAGSFAMFTDITERKAMEARIQADMHEKDVLLKEIHHRVKNNMQIIHSLLNLQAHSVQDPVVRGLFRESQHRIRSMALIHEKLYQSKNLARVDFGVYVQDLVVHLFHAYGIATGSIRFIHRAKNVFLDIQTAIPCGLIVNELVSNALKHAFSAPPRGREPEIRVDLRRTPTGWITLSVRDNGVGVPKGLDVGQAESLGLKLVHALVEQLRGTLRVERRLGTAFRIRFQAGNPSARQQTDTLQGAHP